MHQWKTKAKLAAMKEAAAKAQGKDKGADGAAAAKQAKPAEAGVIAPLPGEKVLVLDESLPDGALEEYFAGLRSSGAELLGQGQGQGQGGDGIGRGAEGAGGKPKRRTIKVTWVGFCGVGVE